MSAGRPLAGKRILVTGGTRGIGRAIALQAAVAGASVTACWVRGQRAADELAAEARDRGVEVALCRGDLTTEKGMDAVLEAVAAGDGLQGFVHCAATGVHKPFAELSMRHFDWTFALNVRAFFEIMGRLLPHLRPGSSVVAVSSQGATRAVPAYAAIGASKGALEALSRHLASELAPRGVRVNVLAPGSVLTDAWKVMPDGEARLAEAERRTPLGRLVSPEDVAAAACFLLGDGSSGIVGHTLVVDGGAGILA